MVHVLAAGFSQHDVIPEVLDLHLLKVEHLFLALLVRDFLKLVRQAAQDLATAGLLQVDRPAGIRTQVLDGCMAGIGQAEVEPAHDDRCMISSSLMM